MAVKKTKKDAKKVAKKAVTKKIVKKAVAKSAKKIVKKAAKNNIKKAVKKSAQKAVKKDINQIVKKSLKKEVVKKISKSVKRASAEIKKTVSKVSSVKQPVKKKLMTDNTASSSKKTTTLLGSLEFTPYTPEKTEGYMNDQQLEHFRGILGAWKQQLMQDVDLTVGHLKEDAESYADPVDRAAQEEGFNLELRTRDRERKLIKKIEQSIDLINTGDYGYCEDCGTEIGVRRLEARPTAMKCIDCKTFQEIREKQLGG